VHATHNTIELELVLVESVLEEMETLPVFLCSILSGGISQYKISGDDRYHRPNEGKSSKI
jgi:hypothetical protein